MIHRLLLIILVLFALQSCSTTTDLELEEVEEVEKPTLQFSPSPFDIDDIDANFSKDISYGPYDRNKFDIFIPISDNPVPLVYLYPWGLFYAWG